MKKRILKNISWLFFDKIIRIFGSLVVGIWVARYLGPEQFGILNYAIAFITFFSLFANLGLRTIVIRELTKYPERKFELLGTTFILKLVGTLFSLLVIYIVISHVKSDNLLIQKVVLIIGAIYFFQVFDTINYFYQAKILSKYEVIAKDSAFIIVSFIKIYLIIYDYELVYFAYANLFDSFLATCFILLIYLTQGNNLKNWKFDFSIAKELLKYSWPLAATTLLVTIHMRVDQLMIDYYLDIEQLGIYTVAVRLSEFWYFIPSIISNTLMPYFVQLRERDNRAYFSRLMQLYSIMFWFGVSVGVFVIFLGQEMIIILFGEAYKNAYSALVLNIWSGIFVSQALARSIWMISENLQKYRLYNNIVAVNINIIGNMLLIPILGIGGAALSTLLTQLLGTWMFSFLWKPLRQSTFAMIKSINPLYLLGSRI